jgi:outer membrane protein assembly factor BamB
LLRLCYPMRADGSYEPNGRGLAIHSGQIFFTETKVPASDPIHIIPYNSQGQTSDSATLPNNTGRHIQDLKFYNNYLFALAGYGENNGLSIFKLDPSDGSVINSFPVTGGPQTSDSDGFVVLPPNGHFLINDGDGGDGITTYREYDEGGVIVANGVVIHLSDYGFSSGTGVALGPDGSSLYFLADINSPSGQVVVRTDLAGNLLDFQSISANNLEDLDVVAP